MRGEDKRQVDDINSLRSVSSLSQGGGHSRRASSVGGSAGGSIGSFDFGEERQPPACMRENNGSRNLHRSNHHRGVCYTLWILSILSFLAYCTTSIRLPSLGDRPGDAVDAADSPARAARLVVEGGTGLRRQGVKPRLLYEQRPPWLPKVEPQKTPLVLKRRTGEQIYVPCGIKFKPPAKPNEMTTHKDFFDSYQDISKAEAYRYNITKIAGRGSYGVVAEAIDNWSGKVVAIKKMTDVFMRRSDALRNLRELKLLRLMSESEDIVQINHILLPANLQTFTSVFFVMEKMEQDLREIVRLAKYLPAETHQVILYQMLRGMHFMHSANVYHRDMKPSNILINSDCKVKICDFSLARPVFNLSQEVHSEWTGYVATRWYRPPEMCLTKFTHWTHAMDVWGMGCVFMEAVLGRPLFPGKDAPELLELITNLLGTPPPHVIAKYPEKVQDVIQQMGPPRPPRNLADIFPAVPADALRVAMRMLTLDPDERPTPAELLRDSYFAGMGHVKDSPVVVSDYGEFAFSEMRKTLTFMELRQLLYEEILYNYHPRQFSSARSTSAYGVEGILSRMGHTPGGLSQQHGRGQQVKFAWHNRPSRWSEALDLSQ
mmetsp:Transcript_38210/g.107985  ORF Transcript_38210/g.107985 Transcript_38210/m.107985 type:complete len:602 (-) Transcript_38210:618-2423(-)